MTASKLKSNPYRGTMDRAAAERKLRRVAERLGATALKLAVDEKTKSVRVGFTVHKARVERECGTQQSATANVACLALWLADRARNMERGLEDFHEAFADSLALAVVGAAPEVKARPGALYAGSRSIEQHIATVRSSLKRLGIAESEVRLTWNTETQEARLRMRLPSGGIVEKSSTRQSTWLTNVGALALWLQARTRNWERGIESMDLERVFAGNLLPARVES